MGAKTLNYDDILSPYILTSLEHEHKYSIKAHKIPAKICSTEKKNRLLQKCR